MTVYRSSAVSFNSGWDETCLLRLGNYYFWIDTVDVLRFKNGPPTSDFDGTPIGGEANTGSNVGVEGVGVFKQKTGVNLEFKTVTSGSNLVSVQDDVVNSQIVLDVRNDLPEWNAGSIRDGVVSSGSPADGQVLRWSAGSSMWVYDDEATGPGPSLKRGIVQTSSFAGNPKRHNVVFATSYSGVLYSVTATPVTSGNAQYLLSIEDKTESGFVINMGSNNINSLIEVDWQTISI